MCFNFQVGQNTKRCSGQTQTYRRRHVGSYAHRLHEKNLKWEDHLQHMVKYEITDQETELWWLQVFG